MKERHYLLKVMGLSAVPRVITFALTAVSLPVMIRAIGARQYGVVVFIGAIAAVVESFADFGVSSAAGKEIAAARESGTSPIGLVVRTWARLQASVALVAFAPLLALTYGIALHTSNIAFTADVFTLVVVTTWLTIALNFIRAALTSMLAFRSLMVFDACESILRSASWLVVAYATPTTFGLAGAGFATTFVAFVFGALLLWRHVRRAPAASVAADPRLSTRDMLRESLNFLWLRLATRVFQSVPVVAFGKLFGAEVVGITAAFARIVEFVNFPFAVVGNALAVRAAGVLASGVANTRRLWDVVSRLLALAVLIAATCYLGAGGLAAFLLPESSGAPTAFTIMSITMLTSVVSSMVAPMSDYVGMLRSRNILLTVFSIAQFPAIWMGAKAYGATGAIAAHVLVIALMSVGYVRIAVSAFFPDGSYDLRMEMKYLLTAIAAALALSHARQFSESDVVFPLRVDGFILDVVVLWGIVLAAALLYRPAKVFFFNRNFLEFQEPTTNRSA